MTANAKMLATPGPWRVIKGKFGSFEVISGIHQIASRCGWSSGAQESHANADLIAAAPDLFVALCDAADLIDALDRCAGMLVGADQEIDALMPAIKAAIAKATGSVP